jgi:restriction endonuclease S subunit
MVPPVEEQYAISAILKLEISKIDTIIEKILHTIDLLKEYRAALISAAVTGKIDVRQEISA